MATLLRGLTAAAFGVLAFVWPAPVLLMLVDFYEAPTGKSGYCNS